MSEASIIGILGPCASKTFVVADGITIGRDPSSHVTLSEQGVSRRHCAISTTDGRFTIRDLGSRNGTFVNSKRIQEHELQHGDCISIGGSVFQFVIHGSADVPDTAPIEFDDAPLPTQETKQFIPLDFSALPKERTFPLSMSQQRLARDFGILLTIAERLRGIRTSESLLWQLIGVMFEAVPAERIAILLNEGGASPEPAFAWDKLSGPGKPVHVSRTILQKVTEQKAGLLINNVSEKISSKSVEALQIHSVLCVPLATPDKPMGFIYLDSRNPNSPFDDGHLHLMTAVATIAALAIENTREMERLEADRNFLRNEMQSQFGMIGDGPAMQELYRFIAKVAAAESTVLIFGESGTGKELVARAIHQRSARSERPFMAINCAALTESLLESELFGYEKGAFTGAVAQKKGLLEVAHGGTLFLDEIGELAPKLQAKLLRVLQEQELIRVGGTKPVKIDVRILAATNRDLSKMAKQGAFRSDLFYRLNVVSCQLRPLRERRDDIPALANHFVRKYASRCKRATKGISDDAMASLLRYDWPGNVRELENVIEHAVVLGSTDYILPDDLPESVLDSDLTTDEEATGYHQALAARKKELILGALEKSGGSFTEAAKLLRIHPNYLHRLVRLLNLRAAIQAEE